MIWKIVETRSAVKELAKVPWRIREIYHELVYDLEREGPNPYGWDSIPLQGRSEIRIKLVREYRVIIEIRKPDLIIVKIAHRKEAYT